MAQYDEVLATGDLKRRPEYWGGYAFRPFYFEFWKGSEYRLNLRQSYEKTETGWIETVLQP